MAASSERVVNELRKVSESHGANGADESCTRDEIETPIRITSETPADFDASLLYTLVSSHTAPVVSVRFLVRSTRYCSGSDPPSV